jgi:hypothetical protein
MILIKKNKTLEGFEVNAPKPTRVWGLVIQKEPPMAIPPGR